MTSSSASKRLHELAASLGSDIPFFLTPGAARCTGRGEKIEPVPPPPALRVLLLKPAFDVPTPDAYRRWRESREIPGISHTAQEVDGDFPSSTTSNARFSKNTAFSPNSNNGCSSAGKPPPPC